MFVFYNYFKFRGASGSVSFPVANSSVDTPESGFLPGVRRVLQQRVRCSVHSLCILNVYFCKIY